MTGPRPDLYPELPPILAVDYSRIPWDQIQGAARAAAPAGNWLSSGVRTGWNELQSLGGSAVQATGKLLGMPGVEQWGADAAASQMAEADRYRRTDLETAPWKTGGASTLPWLGYQAAKQVAQFVPQIAATVLAPEVAVPAALAARGGMVAKGAQLAAKAVPGMIAGVPQAVGSMYQEAVERGDPTVGDAAKAFALSPFYAAADAVELPFLGKLAEGVKGVAQAGVKGIAKTAARGAAADAALELVQEGMQTAMEQSFRSDLTPEQRRANIVDGALTGAAVGGVFGGAAGGVGAIRSTKAQNPNVLTNEALTQTIDQELTAPIPRLQSPAGPFPQMLEAGSSPVAPVASAPNLPQLPVGVYEQPGVPDRPLLTGQVQQPLDVQTMQQGEMFAPGDVGTFRMPPVEAPIAPMPAMQQQELFTPQQADLPLAPGEVRPFVQAPAPIPGVAPAAPPQTQRDLFSPQQVIAEPAPLVTPAAPEITTAEMPRAQQVEAVRQFARDLLGRKSPFIAKLNVTTVDELKAAVQARLEAGSSAKDTMVLAEKLGLNPNQMGEALPEVDTVATTPAAPAAGDPVVAPALRLPDGTVVSGRRADGKRATHSDAFSAAMEGGYANDAIRAALTNDAGVGFITQSGQYLDRAQAMAAARANGQVSAQVTGDQLGSERVAYATPSAAASTVTPQAAEVAATQTAPTAAPVSADPVVAEPQQVQTDPDVTPAPQAAPARAPRMTPTTVRLDAWLESRVPPAERAAVRASMLETMAANPDLKAAATKSKNFQPVYDTVTAAAAPVSADPVVAELQQIQADPAIAQSLRDEAANTQALWEKRSGGKRAQAAVDRLRAAIAMSRDDAPQFIRASAPAGNAGPTGMPPERFQKSFDRILRQFMPGLRSRIVVVENESELPAAIREKAAVDKIAGISGVQYQGKVYVVSSAIKSEAGLQETLFHEAFGHFGARAALGASRQNVLADVFDRAGGVAGLLKLAKQFKSDAALREYLPENLNNFTDTQKASLVDELLAQAAGKTTGTWQTTMRAWAGRVKQATIALLNDAGLGALARQWKTVSANDVARMLYQMRQAALTGQGYATEPAFQSVQQDTAQTQSILQQLQQRVDNINLTDLKGRARETALGWQSMVHIVSRYASLFDTPTVGRNGLQMFYSAMNVGKAIAAKFSRTTFSESQSLTDAFIKQHGQKGAETLLTVMRATEFNIDPAKSWAEHTWLHEVDPQTNQVDANAKTPESVRLKRQVEEMNRAWDRLKKLGGQPAYQAMRDSNDAQRFASLSTALTNMVRLDAVIQTQGLPGFEGDPMEAFVNDPSTDTPAGARAYWEDLLTTQIMSLDAYAEALKEAQGTSVERDRAATFGATILQMAIEAKNAIEATERVPYFHLGRFGNYFVSLQLPKIGKEVDRAKLEQFVDRIAAAGFNDVHVSKDTTQSTVFVRLETQSAMDNFYTLAKTLQRDGLVDKAADAIKKDKLARDQVQSSLLPDMMTKYLERLGAADFLQASPDATADEQAQQAKLRTAMIEHARDLWLDMLPDLSQTKVLSRRNSVPGYAKNMLRSYAFRSQVGTNAVANMVAAAKVSDAMTNMRAAINEVRADTSQPSERVVLMRDVLGELSQRQANRAVRTDTTVYDALRSMNHTFFLGFSPSYAAINMTQIGVLLWPELAKKHGFVGAAKAIAKVTPIAFKVATKTAQLAAQQGGINKAVDAVIERETVKATGISDELTDFIMRVVNSGNIDIGGSAREQARAAEGKTDPGASTAVRAADDVARWASSVGYYTEIVSRLIAALAARELHGTGNSEAAVQYANDTVTQAMFNFSEWAGARQTGKMGMAGPLTPVMFSFQKYNHQLIEKLYRELADTFQKTDPDKAAASRRFLLGHLATVTALTGTLGMPMASVFASVLGKLKDAVDGDDEPTDVVALWRNYLAETFGKDVGEMIARGAPRGLGVDISQRAGEADLLPFSKLLTDRRQFKDAAQDYLADAWGSPFSMLLQLGEGGGKAMDGDVLGGMALMMPNAIKGPVKAYQLTEQGYTDAAGNVLPMEATARDVLTQLLGFTSAKKAEYSEARAIQSGRRTQITPEAARLRRQLAMAVESRDMDRFRELYTEAGQFDQANPGFAVLPGLAESLQRRARARAVAGQTRNPLGIPLRDQAARQLTQFANF